MFGEGISLYDLGALLTAIREKNLTLQVKIGERPWTDLSVAIVNQMTSAVTLGLIKGTSDIRLRLFAKN